MPYVSDAQRGYFNANRKKLEAQGVDVDEWNRASKGLKLPAHKAVGGPVEQYKHAGARVSPIPNKGHRADVDSRSLAKGFARGGPVYSGAMTMEDRVAANPYTQLLQREADQAMPHYVLKD